MKNRKKACSQCGKDLSHMNLDFSQKIICGNCLFSVRKKPHDEVRSETDISAVKKLYDAIKAREIISVAAIRCLEQITGSDFKNTKDFCNKMDQFLDKHHYKGIDLRRARKLTGMEQSELAEWFGVSKCRIKQMETNKKPLSQDSLDFIKVMGFEKTTQLKKGQKRQNKGHSMHRPNKLKIPPEKKHQKQQNTTPKKHQKPWSTGDKNECCQTA